MKEIGWLLLLILFLAALWWWKGRTSGEGPFVTPPIDLRAPFGQYQLKSDVPRDKTSAENGSAEKTPERLAKITLSSQAASAADPNKEYLEIKADRNNTENVVITGLKLKSSRTGESITMGSGAKLAFSGQTNVQQPIVLAPGQRGFIITGQSPIGTSFQLNICAGYFSQFQNFTPSLPSECPRPKESAPTSLSNKCLDYLDNLPACRMPLESAPLGIGNDCAEFISRNFSYNGCVQNHKSEKDFYKDTWMVYLGRSQELWPDKRETITLYNQNGEKITEDSY